MTVPDIKKPKFCQIAQISVMNQMFLWVLQPIVILELFLTWYGSELDGEKVIQGSYLVIEYSVCFLHRNGVLI